MKRVIKSFLLAVALLTVVSGTVGTYALLSAQSAHAEPCGGRGIRRAVAAASPSPFAELVPVGRNRAAEISCLRRIDRVMVMTDRARVVLLMTGPAIARGRSFIPNRFCERAAWWPAVSCAAFATP